tara:strand:+ start:332 stop:727 length:396 start_codon:yes stop_codon:yes gene_type:complete
MAALSSLMAGAPAVQVGHFFTNTSTGTQAITGIGFKPNWIMVVGAQDQEASALQCICGHYDGTTYYTHGHTINNAATSAIYQSTNSAALYQVYDVSANNNVGTVSSFDADGFTINKTTANDALTIFYIVGR